MIYILNQQDMIQSLNFFIFLLSFTCGGFFSQKNLVSGVFDFRVIFSLPMHGYQN